MLICTYDNGAARDVRAFEGGRFVPSHVCFVEHVHTADPGALGRSDSDRVARNGYRCPEALARKKPLKFQRFAANSRHFYKVQPVRGTLR